MNALYVVWSPRAIYHHHRWMRKTMANPRSVQNLHNSTAHSTPSVMHNECEIALALVAASLWWKPASIYSQQRKQVSISWCTSNTQSAFLSSLLYGICGVHRLANKKPTFKDMFGQKEMFVLMFDSIFVKSQLITIYEEMHFLRTV